MEDMSNEKLLEKFLVIAGQLALAENYHQPRKEKHYEKELLKLEEEILRRMAADNIKEC